MSRQKRAVQSRVMPWFERGNTREVLGVIDDPQLGRNDLPSKVNAAINSFANDAYRFAVQDREPLRSLDREQRLEFAGMLAYAAHIGFAMAVYRYAKDLKHVPELASWHHKRNDGGDRGRKTQSSRSQDRRSRVRAMLDQGIEVPEIAKALGCSASTVYRLSQPAGSTAAKPAKKSRRR